MYLSNMVNDMVLMPKQMSQYMMMIDGEIPESYDADVTRRSRGRVRGDGIEESMTIALHKFGY